MNRQKPNRDHDTNELLCKIVCTLDELKQVGLIQSVRLHHVVQHVHHVEELIVAMGGDAMDQEKLKLVLEKLTESKRKLQQALEATPPASTESGVPPQG